MKHFVWVIIIAILIFSACAKDIIVKSPEGLRGFYTGEFIIQEKYGSSSPPEPIRQNVLWTFSDQKFWCDVDTLNNIDIKICNFFGNYELVQTEVVFSNVITEIGTCNLDYIADEDFSYTKVTDENDVVTITLTQRSGPEMDQTVKTITLTKESE